MSIRGYALGFKNIKNMVFLTGTFSPLVGAQGIPTFCDAVFPRSSRPNAELVHLDVIPVY